MICNAFETDTLSTHGQKLGFKDKTNEMITRIYVYCLHSVKSRGTAKLTYGSYCISS